LFFVPLLNKGEDALLDALQPMMTEIKALKQEVNDLKTENVALRQQSQREQNSQQLEIQSSLSNLLSSLKSFNERIETIEKQHGFSQNLLKSMDRKLPHPLQFPMKLFINGETITYRGLMAIALLIMTSTAATVQVAQQLLPGIHKQIYQHLNSVEIRLQRIEKRIK
jgi:hypothetical protein